MKTTLVASSAYTTHANTPLTDNCLLVMHTVKDQFHAKHQLMAECPIDAISKFNELRLEVENNNVS